MSLQPLPVSLAIWPLGQALHIVPFIAYVWLLHLTQTGIPGYCATVPIGHSSHALPSKLDQLLWRWGYVPWEEVPGSQLSHLAGEIHLVPFAHLMQAVLPVWWLGTINRPQSYLQSDSPNRAWTTAARLKIPKCSRLAAQAFSSTNYFVVNRTPGNIIPLQVSENPCTPAQLKLLFCVLNDMKRFLVAVITMPVVVWFPVNLEGSEQGGKGYIHSQGLSIDSRAFKEGQDIGLV